MRLNDEQALIRDTLRAFAQERLAPNAARWDREHHFPRAELAELGALGAFGMVVSERWGGAGADYVSLAVALERSPPATAPRQRSFIVDTKSPGFVVARVEEKTGQRASDTAQILFEHCEVPAENLLGREGEGYRIALANLEAGRIGIAAQSVGMARSAFEAALAYARERQSFGKPIVEHQAIAFWRDVRVCQIYEGTSDIQRMVIGRAL